MACVFCTLVCLRFLESDNLEREIEDKHLPFDLGELEQTAVVTLHVVLHAHSMF